MGESKRMKNKDAKIEKYSRQDGDAFQFVSAGELRFLVVPAIIDKKKWIRIGVFKDKIFTIEDLIGIRAKLQSEVILGEKQVEFFIIDKEACLQQLVCGRAVFYVK